LTGAEDALVVNNNAAATLLGLQVFAQGREVPVSRGELVEIGGGFRMPDVMLQAGCKLIEVGATNRTRREDYAKVIGEKTGCLLKVHPSNYRIEGFHQEVALQDLVELGRNKGVPVFEDLGSGLVLDEVLPHDPREPSVQASVRTGVDLCCFSGDKLLGSCQAGILVGSKKWVGRVAAHPLYRAIRQSKLELAALEATLKVYLFGDPKKEIPVLRGIFGELSSLQKRGKAVLEKLQRLKLFEGTSMKVVASTAFVGSGSTPARGIESRALCIEGLKDPLEILQNWRMAWPSLWGRVEDQAILLDLRSLAPSDDAEVVKVIERFSGSIGEQ
jgi:L-seryl-tRNA(Ser) seleniumtransferase